MHLSVNGAVNVGGKEMYRIDDLESEQVGMQMLQNPYALVPKLEDAKKIVKVMNAAEMKKEEKGG